MATYENDSDALQRVLNSHGHGFQSAVLKKCIQDTPWHDGVHEFPVELHSAGVHVDFILGSQFDLLVAECKRVEGWTWAFARGNSATRSSYADRPCVDYLQLNEAADSPHRGTIEQRPRSIVVAGGSPYNVAVEIKARSKHVGQESASPRALDAAVAQVLRARGGLMEEIARQRRHDHVLSAVVPVIFTNARLAVTEAEMSGADLADGRVNSADAESVNIVWYDYRLPAALRPNIPIFKGPDSATSNVGRLRRLVDREISRSIAIVRPDGLVEFLQRLAQSLNEGGIGVE